MNLNPLNPNYINQMSFQLRPQKKQSKSKILLKPKQTIRQSRFESESNIPLSNKKEIYKSLTAKFVLQNHLNTSNILYTYQGYLIAYLRKQNIISGKSFIIFPQGIVAYCNVINRKLSGWISICKKGQFYNLSHFFGGRFHGDQYTYDLRCGLMIESRYLSGKLQSVKRGVADTQLTFQRCLKSKQLVDLLNQTLQYSFYEKYFPKIESKLGDYYGSKNKSMPSGVGVLVTDHEYFYGNFQYGLLSGNGVMVFPNGNTYIGQFEEGMMRGFGNYIIYGNRIFKENEFEISQQQFYQKKNVESFYDNQEISTIFGPIINFYQKLKVIYQNRRKQHDQSSESFVNVQVQNDEEVEQDKQELSYENYSPRADTITELLKTSNNKQEKNVHQKIQNNIQSSKEVIPKHNKLDKGKKEKEKEEESQAYHYKIKKQKWIMRNDHEWDEIIEELGEQNVSKQDDFLNPQQQKIQTEETQQLKKYPINPRLKAQNMVNITDSPPDAMDRLQNQLIRKITQHK